MDLLSARDLMAADKTGTSDPYVVFTVNGERLYKSDVIKKALNPKWNRARFTAPIVCILCTFHFMRLIVFISNQE